MKMINALRAEAAAVKRHHRLFSTKSFPDLRAPGLILTVSVWKYHDKRRELLSHWRGQTLRQDLPLLNLSSLITGLVTTS